MFVKTPILDFLIKIDQILVIDPHNARVSRLSNMPSKFTGLSGFTWVYNTIVSRFLENRKNKFSHQPVTLIPNAAPRQPTTGIKKQEEQSKMATAVLALATI